MSVVAYRIFVPCERMAQVPSPHNLFERRRHTFSKWEKIGEQLLLRVIFCCCMQARARVALQLCWGARVWCFPKTVYTLNLCKYNSKSNEGGDLPLPSTMLRYRKTQMTGESGKEIMERVCGSGLSIIEAYLFDKMCQTKRLCYWDPEDVRSTCACQGEDNPN